MDENAKRKLPQRISEEITKVLRDMEKEEIDQLGVEGPVVLEEETPLWFVSYKTMV